MRNRGTNILGYMFKSMHDSAAGRIIWMSNMWAVVGGVWDKHRCTNKWKPKGLLSNKGTAVLVRIRCTSTCPKPPAHGFFSAGRSMWNVPATICRQCTYHRKAGGQYRFPRCLARSCNEPLAATVDEFNGLLAKAVSTTDSLVRGRKA